MTMLWMGDLRERESHKKIVGKWVVDTISYDKFEIILGIILFHLPVFHYIFAFSIFEKRSKLMIDSA
jgi:hypothetical protein